MQRRTVWRASAAAISAAAALVPGSASRGASARDVASASRHIPATIAQATGQGSALARRRVAPGQPCGPASALARGSGLSRMRSTPASTACATISYTSNSGMRARRTSSPRRMTPVSCARR